MRRVRLAPALRKPNYCASSDVSVTFEDRCRLQQDILLLTDTKVVNNENSKVWQHRNITDSVAQTLKCKSDENICSGLLDRVHSAKSQLDDSESGVVPVHNDAGGVTACSFACSKPWHKLHMNRHPKYFYNKAHPGTVHEGPEGESRCRSTLSLTSAVDGGWVVNGTPRPLYHRERLGTHFIGGRVGPMTGLDRYGKSRPPPGFDPRTVQLVTSRYNGCTIPAQYFYNTDIYWV